jgi:RluA family pseudouridine synthase
MELQVLFEDGALVAVNKPAGVTVIPARDEPPEACLVKRLEAERGERLWVVHRIDRDTSGLVLFARTAEAHRKLSMAFEGHEVEKSYLAWARGVPTPAEGTIDLPLHTARKGRMRPALPGEEGALASTSIYRVALRAETALGTVTRVAVSPKSGRQHQIRVHLRALGAPLLVDALYGRCEGLEAGGLGEGSPPVPRLTLHAAGAVLPHPTSGARLELSAPLPDDLAALDRWLGR